RLRERRDRLAKAGLLRNPDRSSAVRHRSRRRRVEMGIAMKRPSLRIDPDQAWALAGVVAAMAIAIVANVYATSHFTRWDWTSSKRYTLSPPTLETLQSLNEPVEIWVLLGGGDPMEQSVKQILVSYAAETRKLD